MIDNDGYRPNVGIIITNGNGQLMWARRYGQNSWQFPQGGINQGETPEEAMYRELHEEVGLEQKDVKILAVSKFWLRYKLPKRMIRWESKPLCIGQKQRWFLLELIADDHAIDMISNVKPEFDGYKWVTYWYPIRQVVSFKRDVYRRALKEFSSIVLQQENTRSEKNFESKIYSFDKRRGNRLNSSQNVLNDKNQRGNIAKFDHDKMAVMEKQNEKNEKNEKNENSIAVNLKNKKDADLHTHTTGKTETKKNLKKKKRWPQRINKKKNLSNK